MEDSDNVLKSLRAFREEKPEAFPEELEAYITRISTTGETLFPWHEVKDVFVHKMQLSIDQFIADETPSDKAVTLPNVENVSCEEMKSRILTKINDFVSAPFTIQRLAELVMHPRKHYKKPIKWLRGLEKNVNVVSTVDPFGTKIVNESKLVNGVDIRNGLDESVMASPERTLLPPPPVNSPATAIPGWFNVAGNGDGWPGARNSGGNSSGNSSSTGDGSRSSDRGDDDVAETEASVPSAASGAVPLQNGTKRLKTHHVTSPPAVSESGDSPSSSAAAADTVSTSTTVTTTAAAAATTGPAPAAVEENSEDVSSDSISSEASEASSSSEPSDATPATPATTEVAAAAVEAAGEDCEKSMDEADTPTSTTTAAAASSDTSAAHQQPPSEPAPATDHGSEAQMLQAVSSEAAAAAAEPEPMSGAAESSEGGEVSTSETNPTEDRLSQSPTKDANLEAASKETPDSVETSATEQPREDSTVEQKDQPMEQAEHSEAETTTPSSESKETEQASMEKASIEQASMEQASMEQAADSSDCSAQSMDTE